MQRLSSMMLRTAAVRRSVVPSRFISTTMVRRADEKSASSATASTGLSLSFVTPNESIVSKKSVYMVTVPAVTGVMGVLSDHAPTIAQLKPGVVNVHTADINDVTHKYFVSGGFAVVNTDNTCSVTAVEAIKLDDLDVASARQLLNESQASLVKAVTEKDKAEAQIAVDVYEALISALESK